MVYYSHLHKVKYVLERRVWDHVQQHTIGGQAVLTLSYEDNLIYLLVHMAKHFLLFGFGLRQLCDICLFVETYALQINWPSFWSTINQLGYKHFAMTVFETCRQFLGLKTVIPVIGGNTVRQETVLMLVQDVISSGVFGRKNQSHYFGNRVIKESEAGNCRKGEKGASFVTLRAVIFLPLVRMGNEYTYVRKCPLLLPIAWLHRIWIFIFAHNNSPRKIMEIIKNAPIIAKQRTELIKQLEL